MSDTGRGRSSDSYAERLRLLVDAGIFFSRELHLDDVLDRIVQTASTVIGARYAALGVIDEQGSGLSNFVFSGLTTFDRERIGALPVGHGLLGALITEPRPIRLDRLADDARSVGFPANHPPMASFLGVPIEGRDGVFGNLYLTEKEGGNSFSEEDERLAIVLAGLAGVAIENARLYDEARRNEAEATRRQHAMELVQEVGSAVVAELDPARVLRLITQSAHRLVEAATCVLMLQDDMTPDLIVRVGTGRLGPSLEGSRVPRDNSLSGLALENLEAVLIEDTVSDARVNAELRYISESRSAIVCPLIVSGEGIGTLAVMDAEIGKFDEDDLFVIKSFADLGSIAMQNAKAMSAERERAELEVELVEARLRESMRTSTLQAVIRAQEEERTRIARELHDSFGQSLTSILLGLKVIEEEGTIEQARSRVADLRDVAAAAATEVRRIAYELRPTLLDDLGLEAAIGRYAHDVETRTGVRLTLSLSLGTERLESEIETVVYRIAQEAINNAVKHAHAGPLEVSLTRSTADVRLVVADDGSGFDLEQAEGKGLGLLGMRERSELVGGKLSLRSEQGEGTRVELQVPLSRS